MIENFKNKLKSCRCKIYKLCGMFLFFFFEIYYYFDQFYYFDANKE
jgi:hypothetical protein